MKKKGRNERKKRKEAKVSNGDLKGNFEGGKLRLTIIRKKMCKKGRNKCQTPSKKNNAPKWYPRLLEWFKTRGSFWISHFFVFYQPWPDTCRWRGEERLPGLGWTRARGACRAFPLGRRASAGRKWTTADLYYGLSTDNIWMDNFWVHMFTSVRIVWGCSKIYLVGSKKNIFGGVKKKSPKNLEGVRNCVGI